ncbi:MAG: response regulator [Thermodesulfobacteriota bacterium]|nr:response regulator [Thermodesulfobacteriota bacterium]
MPAYKSQQTLKREKAEAAAEEEQPFQDRPVKILVMDDDEMICDVVSQMLEKTGFFVETAPDGEDAVKMYKQSMDAGASFDVVIMDLTIPGGIGGKEAVKELLAIDPKAIAIVSSGYADDPVMADYAEYGFKAIIAKPYTLGNLRKVLNQVLK